METINVKEIRLDGNTQPREGINQHRVFQYRQAYCAGTNMPPVKIVRDGTNLWLVDGFHRTRAAIRAGLKTIQAEVIEGTYQDAVWLSATANIEHDAAGIYRSNDDKRRAVEMALGIKPELSDSAIAKHCGVNHKTVAKYREAILGNSQDRSQQAIIGNSEDRKQPAQRTVTRNGKTYKQNVSNIGKRKSTGENPQSDRRTVNNAKPTSGKTKLFHVQCPHCEKVFNLDVPT